jgi:hypothetical protein
MNDFVSTWPTVDEPVTFPDGGPGEPVVDITLDEATRQYEALMSNVPYVPRALEEELTRAIAQGSGRACPRRHATEVDRAQTLAAEHDKALFEANAAVDQNNDIERTDVLTGHEDTLPN